MHKLILLFALISLVCADPTVPVWANKWQQNFEHFAKQDGEIVSTQGIYLYDYTEGIDYIWRKNCRVDSLSRKMYDEDFSCSQQTHNSVRYIFAEEHNHCCICGHVGLQRPDWLQIGGGEWKGYKRIDGEFYNVFATYAGPFKKYPIYNLYNLETGIQSYLYRPDLLQKLLVFDQSSYTTTLNPEYKIMPEACKKSDVKKCPGTCQYI